MLGDLSTEQVGTERHAMHRTRLQEVLNKTPLSDDAELDSEIFGLIVRDGLFVYPFLFSPTWRICHVQKVDWFQRPLLNPYLGRRLTQLRTVQVDVCVVWVAFISDTPMWMDLQLFYGPREPTWILPTRNEAPPRVFREPPPVYHERRPLTPERHRPIIYNQHPKVQTIPVLAPELHRPVVYSQHPKVQTVPEGPVRIVDEVRQVVGDRVPLVIKKETNKPKMVGKPLIIRPPVCTPTLIRWLPVFSKEHFSVQPGVNQVREYAKLW